MEYSNPGFVDENAMDVEAPENSASSPPRTTTAQENPFLTDRYDVVVVSSVGLHVEGPIPFINPEMPVEQHAIVQIESNDEGYVNGATNILPHSSSTPVSVASSRANTPTEILNVESQSEESNNETRKRCLSEDDDDDGRLCPICLDNWTNTGAHRICALKCGHLFGYKCVNRWLESQKLMSCPTCKIPVEKTDLRYIYAKKLIAVDTRELDELQQLLDATVEEKNRILHDLCNYVVKVRSLNDEIMRLKKNIMELTHNSQGFCPTSGPSYNNHPISLSMDKSLEICRQSGCRVFDVKYDTIMVSTKSPNHLFSGFGIRKVNISQYKPLAFIPLHNAQIRDISYHPINSWVLTASMDESFKVVDTSNNSVIYSTSQCMPLWSCCWDSENHNILYIGTQLGAVLKYDIRSINEPVCTLTVPGDMSPVVSVASIPSMPDSDFLNGGVISCKLNSLWVFENATEGHLGHNLSLEGPFVSMKYQNDTKQLLVSSRPNSRTSYSRHTLCTLEKDRQDKVNCNVIHSFQGGGMQKLLSKSCFLSDKQEYVAAHQESTKCVYLWSINTGQRVGSIPAHSAVLDLRGIQTNSGNYLVSLTEKKLEFFKFV